MKILFLGAKNPETARMINAVQRVTPNFEPIGFLDNDKSKKGREFLGYPIFGGIDAIGKFDPKDVKVINLITGSTRARYETSKAVAAKGFKFANFIHPTVDLTHARLGVGNYIQENVVVQASAEIGNNSSIHTGAIIAHEVKIGNSVFIAHVCSISGEVEIGDGTFVGTNSTVIPGIKIGKWASIGAGTVVIKDVPDHATVVGNPGKIIKTSDRIYDSGDIF